MFLVTAPARNYPKFFLAVFTIVLFCGPRDGSAQLLDTIESQPTEVEHEKLAKPTVGGSGLSVGFQAGSMPKEIRAEEYILTSDPIAILFGYQRLGLEVSTPRPISHRIEIDFGRALGLSAAIRLHQAGQVSGPFAELGGGVKWAEPVRVFDYNNWSAYHTEGGLGFNMFLLLGIRKTQKCLAYAFAMGYGLGSNDIDRERTRGSRVSIGGSNFVIATELGYRISRRAHK